uniref:Terminase large subunit n=2 Tax=unclassified Caudoviricetes TaxID=2788787 RepID=A0A8S5T867_9CAUD|nr:MAG TPA: terminase large subunit [Siphoviridae sp. ctAsH36]DAG00976.1 MAG TPA: terminase large subunit [Siphoviridae sp. ct0Bp21]
MANEENLKPFSKLKREESVKNGQKGGIASGQVRRQKKTLSELAKMIAENPAPAAAKKKLTKMGISDEDANNNACIVAAVYDKAIKGNMQAVDKWEQLVAVSKSDESKYELPARVLGKAFVDINRQIKPNIEYVFEGGRGGLKSSYVAFKIVELIKNNPQMHACITRQVAGTLKDSVYANMKWAINELGLMEEFECKVSPLEIKYIKTGQTIYFRGLDDETKLKSIKPEFGYIGILWKEEKDQMKGDAQERSVNQSVLRGGDESYDFSSYNPPKSKSNWVNRIKLVPNPKRVIHHSSYLEAPAEWLGQKFIDDAAHLKEINPEAYEHEYLGVPNGDGGNVFEYLEIRDIADEEISRMDRIFAGVDYGWYPDQFCYLRTYYDSAREKIYLIDELYVNKWSNSKTAEWIKKKGYDDYTMICDSAEPKSVNDFRDAGLPARGAIKGPGSIEYGFKFLQTKTLVIDPKRTPNAYKEITEYEYDRDKEGNVISGYPDGNDHAISALRYAYEPLFNRRGNSA